MTFPKSFLQLMLAVSAAGFTSVAAQSAAPAAPATPAAPVVLPTHAQAMATGAAVARWAYAGEVDSLLAIADSAAPLPPNLKDLLLNGVSQMSLQLGAETRVRSERVMRVGERLEYWRLAEYDVVPVPIVLRVILGAPGTWRGFTANTEDQMPEATEVKP